MFFPGLGWMGMCGEERHGSPNAELLFSNKEGVGPRGPGSGFWLCPPGIMSSN